MQGATHLPLERAVQGTKRDLRGGGTTLGVGRHGTHTPQVRFFQHLHVDLDSRRQDDAAGMAPTGGGDGGDVHRTSPGARHRQGRGLARPQQRGLHHPPTAHRHQRGLPFDRER